MRDQFIWKILKCELTPCKISAIRMLPLTAGDTIICIVLLFPEDYLNFISILVVEQFIIRAVFLYLAFPPSTSSSI